MDTLRKEDNNNISDRIGELKALMRSRHVNAVIIPTSDYHNSEYVGDYFKVREYFSGFTGSNGTLVVTDNNAGLWTDGRYFIQAANELYGSGIELFKMGEPNVPRMTEYLLQVLKPEDTVAFDSRTFTASQGIDFCRKFSKENILIDSDFDAAVIWHNRPKMSCEKIFWLEDGYCGETVLSKINRVREAIAEKGGQAHFISKLDDIMWLLNIRGADIECNPVALSNLYLDMDRVVLFIQKAAVDINMHEYLDNFGIEIRDYEDSYTFFDLDINDTAVCVDYSSINYKFLNILKKKNKPINTKNPTELFKSIKNDIELDNIRKTYIEDSAVVTRYIYFLKQNINKQEMDEYSASMILDSMRAQIPGFIELSFPTIGAFGENAAIIHYEPPKTGSAKLDAKGMFLVDSGGQYLGGTTDVTRTIVLGEITDEIRKYYTLTTIGMLRLADAAFLSGCTGRNLDIIARTPLWEAGYDYKHGTGHGIGYVLNVHEGPQNIRWKYIENAGETVLMPGMIVSDEPGVYMEDKFGIRIENILEVKEKLSNSSGVFLGFEHLTYVPIDLEAIDISLLEKKDRKLLNDYHRKVFSFLLPYMKSREEIDWLKYNTREI